MAVSERDEFTFEIREHLGTLREYNNGWTKELNLVAWNNKDPKYDIRDWNPTHENMSRGVTLHRDEMRKLASIMKELVI